MSEKKILEYIPESLHQALIDEVKTKLEEDGFEINKRSDLTEEKDKEVRDAISQWSKSSE